jgi:hypothetical protein
MCAGTAPTRTAPGYTKNFAFHYAFTPDNGWALYSVRTDPSCEHNLAAAEPDTVTRLRTAYRGWWRSVLHCDYGEVGSIVAAAMILVFPWT